MMRSHERRRGARIKRKILFYLLAFVCVILAMLWIFQTLLFDDIYSAIVRRKLGVAADTIERALDGDVLSDVTTYISQENDMCVSVYKFIDKTGYPMADAHISYSCLLHNIDTESLVEFYTRARASDDGVYIKRLTLTSSDSKRPAGPHGSFAPSLPDSVIYTRAVVMGDGSDAVIFLNCALSPFAATVNTLTAVLCWISVITMLLAVAFAYFIAWRVSGPIADVNREAKELANCRYNGNNVRRGYREIDELSETLTYAAGELSKVERMRSELIANISHDLRTPLTLIEGYTEMMRDIPGENSPENMQVVIDETHRLSTLVSDLLELSRLETGKQTIYPSPFDLSEALSDTVSRVIKLYGPDGYKFVLYPTGGVHVSADKTRILQVIYNLIGNAVNYTGEDKTVTVTEAVSGGVVRISVTDTGDGIAEEDLPLIWDRYYKVDKTHKRGVGGSGLGLSIVKEILLLHNARFGVTSDPGHGSTFWFELPVIGE